MEKEFYHNLEKYLSNAMTPDQREEFEQILDDDPEAQNIFAGEQKFDLFLRRNMTQEEAPYEVREAVFRKLDQKRLTWWQQINKKFPFDFLAWSLSFAMILCVSGVVFYNTQRQNLFAEAVMYHVNHLHQTTGLDIRSSDVDEVIAWFDGKIDFELERPHIDPTKVFLVGARLVEVDGENAAMFVYEKNGRTITALSLDMKKYDLESLNAKEIKSSDYSIVVAKKEKGFENVLCYHKESKTGCMFSTKIARRELLKLMG